MKARVIINIEVRPGNDGRAEDYLKEEAAAFLDSVSAVMPVIDSDHSVELQPESEYFVEYLDHSRPNVRAVVQEPIESHAHIFKTAARIEADGHEVLGIWRRGWKCIMGKHHGQSRIDPEGD